MYMHPAIPEITSGVIETTGIHVVTGEAGSGKTSLLRHIARGRASRAIFPRTPARSRITISHICDAIVHDLTGRYPYGSLEKRARMMRDALISTHERAGRPVLLIDDADQVPLQTLRDIPYILEACYPISTPIITMTGTPRLSHLLAHESTLGSLSAQAIRSQIPPPMVEHYIRAHHLDARFTPDAVIFLDSLSLPIRGLARTVTEAVALADQAREDEVSCDEIAQVSGTERPATTQRQPAPRASAAA